MITPEALHYIAAILSICLGAFGGGIGQGIAGFGAQGALARQPAGNFSCFRMLIIGLALIESGTIIALVGSLLTLFGRFDHITFELGFAELGIGCAIGIASAAISIASSFVVKASMQAISRQPFFAQKILTFMLISQSIIEAPVIFAFIVALLVRTKLVPGMMIDTSLQLFAACLVIALGCIGPCIGQGLFAYAACLSIGINKNAYNKIFPYALLNEAIIETPMIFCVLLALLMLYTSPSHITPLMSSIKFLIAAITFGIGSIGSSIGIGYVASRSCYNIALDMNSYGALVRSTLLAVAFIESSMIYALIIAMLLIV